MHAPKKFSDEIFFNFIAKDELITFQTFGEKVGPQHFSRHYNRETALELGLKNQSGAGIYWMVNEGNGSGRSAENVVRVRCLFIDLDDSPLEPVLEFAPHIITESTPGRYHCYWKVQDVPLEEFRTLQKYLIKRFNADTSAHDLPRVLRVPGYVDKKRGENFLVRIHSMNDYPALKYPSDPFFQKMKEGIQIEEYSQAPRKHGKTATQTIIKKVELEAALEKLSSDDYQEWIEVGMCLREWNESEGFHLWKRWSMQSAKYVEGDCERKWVSFKSSGLNPQSILWRARRLGYKTPLAAIEPIPRSFGSEKGKAQKTLVSENNNLQLGRSLIESAPGVVGRLANWINETAVQPQPALSLAAAITLVSLLKAHKVRTETDLRTNLYILGLARSGSGKNHPLTAIKEVLKQLGQDHLLGGRPASSEGLIRMLSDSHGRLLIPWDEFGGRLQQMTSDRASPHHRAILETLMELFTHSHSLYLGTERANNDGRNPTKRVDQPCLSVLAMSTPGAFYDSLSSAYAASGFLPRWLVFEVPHKRVKKRKKIRPISEVPSLLLDELRSIVEWPTNDSPSSRFSEIMQIVPRTLRFGDGVEDYLEELDDWFYDQGDSENDAIQALWTRGNELTQKLALVCSDREELSISAVEWASEVAKKCVQGLSQAVSERVGNTQIEKEYKMILGVVRGSGLSGLPRWQLNRKTRSLDPRKRDILLNALVESGDLAIDYDQCGKSGKIIETIRISL